MCLNGAHQSLCLQVDILSNDDEVQEVVQFVSDNAKRVLNVDTARVIPISSRLALDAKLAIGDEAAGKSSLLLQYIYHGSCLVAAEAAGQSLLCCSAAITECLPICTLTP